MENYFLIFRSRLKSQLGFCKKHIDITSVEKKAQVFSNVSLNYSLVTEMGFL